MIDILGCQAISITSRKKAIKWLAQGLWLYESSFTQRVIITGHQHSKPYLVDSDFIAHLPPSFLSLLLQKRQHHNLTMDAPSHLNREGIESDNPDLNASQLSSERDSLTSQDLSALQNEFKQEMKEERPISG